MSAIGIVACPAQVHRESGGSADGRRRAGIMMVVAGLAVMAPLKAQVPPTQEPAVVIEGIVADPVTKERLLAKLREVYGSGRVVDRIQVEAIATPPNWGEYAEAMISGALRQVSRGTLEVDGKSVRIRGEVGSVQQRDEVANRLALASNMSYTVTSALRVGSRQTELDQTLANRIIEFRSGSATLTEVGTRILDEMRVPMARMGVAKFLVVGHTDSVGPREQNLHLSKARAGAVKAYLVSHGLAADAIMVEGNGPDQPVADNATVEGRARNRRIEIRIR